jgi:PAS domain S-box-containing protein
VIACAASAGGFHVVLEILRALPEPFAVPIVILMHVRHEEPYTLPDVLRRATRRSVQTAVDGDRLAPGVVYVAPPDWHLVFRRDGHLALTSSNEELETMNEELHSTNEELHTINDEVRMRSDELNRSNSLLDGILRSIRGGVVVVDRDLEILLWNARAEDLWGLRRDEVVGRNLLSLDIGLPVEQLRVPLRAALTSADNASESDVQAVNRRGRQVVCRVSTMPLVADSGGIDGAIITMDQLDHQPSDHQG